LLTWTPRHRGIAQCIPVGTVYQAQICHAGMAPCILNLGTGRSWVVNLRPLPLEIHERVFWATA